jgi:hypothetical protein
MQGAVRIWLDNRGDHVHATQDTEISDIVNDSGNTCVSKTLDNPRLPHTRLADQDQVVLPALRQDLGDFQHLLPPPDQRRQNLARIMPVLDQRRGRNQML